MHALNNPLVSVIIITYKRPKEIVKRALNSVVKQTYKNIEIIVVNDYPEVNSVEAIGSVILDFGDSRIKYIVHEKNMGACKARNTGIIASTGKFIALLDDDDEWLPEKIEQQLSGFSSKKIGLVYSPFYNITKDSTEELVNYKSPTGNILDNLLWSNCIGGSSMPIIRREVFDTCGLFDETLLSSQDYDMWIRIAQRYKIAKVNKPLIRRYVLTESISTNFEKKQQGFEAFTRKHFTLYKNHMDALNYRYARRVNKCIEQKQFKVAWKMYKSAIKAKKFSKYNLIEPLKGIFKILLNNYRSVS